MNHAESKIQAEIIQALNTLPVYAMYVKNEGKKTMAQAMRDKALGLRSGVSDLLVFTPRGLVCLEVKTETGRQSYKQKDFQAIAEWYGHKYFIVRSAREAVEVLEQFIL